MMSSITDAMKKRKKGNGDVSPVPSKRRSPHSRLRLAATIFTVLFCIVVGGWLGWHFLQSRNKQTSEDKKGLVKDLYQPEGKSKKESPVKMEPAKKVEKTGGQFEDIAGKGQEKTELEEEEKIEEVFRSKFKLMGIYSDPRDPLESKVLINGHWLKIGESIDGAKVIEISTDKVKMKYRNDEFEIIFR